MGVTARVRYPVDSDEEIAAAIRRYKELREWRQGADAEMDEIKDKLSTRMAEHKATALTICGVTVARFTSFEREGFDAKTFKITHPRLWKRFSTSTTVERIDVP